MRYLLVLIAFLSAPVAADVLSWEPPTTRVDGQPLDPATELSHYNLYCGEQAPHEIPATSVDGEYEIPNAQVLPGYGEYECTLTAVDTGGLESAKSNAVTVAWPPAEPEAPTVLINLTR